MVSKNRPNNWGETANKWLFSNPLYLMVLQRILHGKCLDELLRADKTQSVLKGSEEGEKIIRMTVTVLYKGEIIKKTRRWIKEMRLKRC